MPTTNSVHSDITQFSPLHEAIKQADFDEIKYLIESGENIDDLDEQGLTILSALFNNNVIFYNRVTWEELEIYRQGNTDGFIYLDDCYYAQIIDEKDGFLDVVTMMINYGADPNLADADGNTPLHWAAYYGFNGVVSALLNAGANPTVQNVERETPNQFAQENNHVQISERLLTEERYQAVCHRLDTIDAPFFNFLSMRDLTFFSSVAKPETIQRFLQDKMNPVCNTPF